MFYSFPFRGQNPANGIWIKKKINRFMGFSRYAVIVFFMCKKKKEEDFLNIIYFNTVWPFWPHPRVKTLFPGKIVLSLVETFWPTLNETVFTVINIISWKVWYKTFNICKQFVFSTIAQMKYNNTDWNQWRYLKTTN